MIDYRIGPAAIADAYAMASLDRRPRSLVRQRWYASTGRKAAFLDGAIVALWGIERNPSLMVREGRPWLLATPAVRRYPVTFMRAARRELQDMLKSIPRLADYLTADCDGDRFLTTLGFRIGPPEPIGIGGAMLRRVRLGD